MNIIRKIKWKPLIICLAIPLALGALSGLLTKDGMEAFYALNQPPLSPPRWVFPVVWTVLYIMMGTASYLVFMSGLKRRTTALIAYGVQLALNFLWTLIFFGLGKHLSAFIWLVALWLLIWANMIAFAKIRNTAGWLLLPYLLWVTFAGYLNYGIYLLN